MKNQNIKFAVLVFFIAVVIRLIPVLANPELGIGLDDMFQYDMLAESIAEGDGYRWYAQEDLDLIKKYIDLDFITEDYDPKGILTSFRPPGYPAFLAIIYFIGGLTNRFFITRIVQAFLIGTIAPLTCLIAIRVFPKKEIVGKIAAWMMVFYPMFIVYPLSLATENLFIPLVLFGTLLLLKAGESDRLRDFIFAGIVFGLAALTRSVITAIVPFIMFWIWVYQKNRKAALIFPAVILLITAPWSIRNTLLHGKFYYIESALGYDLHQGYYPGNDGDFSSEVSMELMPYLDDAVRDELGKELAFEFIRENPENVPYYMVRRAGYFFGFERRAISFFYSSNFLGYIQTPLLILLFSVYTLPFAVIVASGVFGLPFVKWEKRNMLLLLISLGYIAPHIVILAEPRFHLTIVPFLAILAAQTWVCFKEQWKVLDKRAKVIRLAISCLLLGLVIFNFSFEIFNDLDKLKILFGPDGNKSYFGY